MSHISLPVDYIADTAFLTALYRAIESDRPDAHFKDSYARVLAGVHGEQLAQAMPDVNLAAAGCAVRTCVFDELILRVVKENKVDTLLNLGSGLDTRPYRLPLPTSLHWIEIDLPIVLTYKADKLGNAQPVCNLKSIPCDITDAVARQTLWHEIKTTAKQGFIVTEGLLIYLTAEQVAVLATDLYTQSQFRWWLCDLASPVALQQIQKLLDKTPAIGEVRMQFAPEEGTDFFRQYGWETVEFHSFFEQKQRLNRGAISEEILSQMSQEHFKILYQMSGCVLLTRPE